MLLARPARAYRVGRFESAAARADRESERRISYVPPLVTIRSQVTARAGGNIG